MDAKLGGGQAPKAQGMPTQRPAVGGRQAWLDEQAAYARDADRNAAAEATALRRQQADAVFRQTMQQVNQIRSSGQAVPPELIQKLQQAAAAREGLR
jgi:hypothetical protein